MPATTEDTFRLMWDLLLTKDMDAVADLFAEDGVAEFPFAVDVSQRRRVGREAIRDYLAAFPEQVDMHEVTALTVHHTEQPETIVAELTVNGRTVSTGEPYQVGYIVVCTARDGSITRYRDYWSPLATAAAAGTLPELLDSLRTEATR